MEYNSYLLCFGENVRSIRKEKGMNQVEFYNYLFPNNSKEIENIKKYMNAIENGKKKSIDFSFFVAICSKCEISSDYLLGFAKDYSSHELEFVCQYTGLENYAAQQMHQWNQEKNNGADLSMIGGVYSGDDGEKEMEKAYAKQSAIKFLKIINYLFKGGAETLSVKRKKQERKYSNLSILHAIYQMSMVSPEIIRGEAVYDDNDTVDILVEDYPYLKYELSKVKMDATKPLFLEDNNKVWYTFHPKEVLENIAKKHLDEALDRLISHLNS